MKIVFMGTPDFAVPTLQALVDKHDVVAVVTQPDRRRGRGKKLHFTPVKEEAIKHHIEVLQPESIKEKDVIEKLEDYNADVFVVAAYGQILSKEILDMPRLGCLNVHASLLPEYRGAAPIQWCLINGECETGITIMYMDEGLDTGDMLLKEIVAIDDDESASTLHDKLSDLGGGLILEALHRLECGTCERIKQDDHKSSYASMITKDMGHIDFSQTSQEIINLIKGLTPWPGTYTFYNGERLKIWNAHIYDTDKKGDAGQVIEVIAKEGFIVKTKDSAIIITEVQGASGKRMDTSSYLLGNQIEIGQSLS